MKSKPFGALFGLLALVAILGVAPAFGQTADEVDIQAGAGSSANAACVTTNNCFSPNPITVAPGTEVEWKNGDTVSHTVTSGKVTDDNAGSLFDSGLIKKGADFKFTFANAGTYDYFCTVHPWMTGQVIVGAA
ncbi:MAG: cupredoxin domain-containing protein, partial [Thaumarchaeota archaeon]|nr:cupredoxin domain-containing protein [Nitrososphaerota archaeon]